MQEWCSPALGCPRHKDHWIFKRCAHLGSRFVVWSQMIDWTAKIGWSAYIDYVEDLPDGDVIVQGNYTRNQEQAEEMWALMVKLMESGEAPNPERGT